MTRSDRRLLYTIVGAYLGLGISWILVTDLLVNTFVPPGPLQAIIESSKGAFYVAATGVGLFVLVRSLLSWRRESIDQTTAREEARDQLVFQGQLLDAVGQAVVAIDPLGSTTYWNQAATEMYGWSESEALGVPLKTLTGPRAQGGEAGHPLADRLSAGEVWSGQIEIPRKNGSAFPAILQTTPVADQDGDLMAVIGVSTDVSDLANARERLTRSEELHRTVLENISDAVFLTDQDGNLTYVCPTVEAIFGFEQSEAMGLGSISELLGEELAGTSALDGKDQVSNIETTVVDRQNRSHDLLTTVKKVDMAEGTLLYTCRDVTDRIAAETQREDALDRLEILRQIDLALLSAQTVEGLLSETLGSLHRIVDYETATFFFSDRARESLRVAYTEGHPPELVKPGDEVSVGELGLARDEDNLDLPVRYVHDLASLNTKSGLVQRLLDAGLRSVLSLRLFARGDLVGLLALGAREPNAFTEEDVRGATEAANSLGIGVQNQVYFQRQQDRVRAMDTLRKAALDLTIPRDLEHLSEAVCRRSLELMGADNAHMFHYTDGTLEFAAAAWREGVPEQVFGPPREDGLTATVARSGEVFSIDATGSHPLYQDYRPTWNGGIIGIPVKYQDQVIAVMTMGFETPHRFEEDEIRAVQLLSDQVAIAITNARSYQEVERQRAELGTLLEIARRLATRHTLDEVLQTIVDAVVDTVAGAEAASVMLFDEEKQELAIRAWRGYKAEVIGKLSLTPDLSLVGDVLHSDRPLVINGAQDRPSYQPFGIPELDRLKATFGVPLRVGGETVGALFADNFTEEQAFSEDDLPFMESLAAQTRVAIESASLFDQIQASRRRLAELSSQLVEVQEEERRHLARELHDQIGQSLTGLKLLLEMSDDLPEDAAQENLGQAQELVSELLGQIRDLSLDLRPSMLDDLGLLPALNWLVERMSRTSGLEIELVHGVMEERFSPQLETAAYRVVQEGLTNTIRHSQSKRAIVRVSRDDESLRVEVEDFGRGFDVDHAMANPSTSGLSGMWERVTLLGGRITIESLLEEGSAVTVEFPLVGTMERRSQERGA